MAYTAFYLRACSKCGGDLGKDQDWTGPYWVCLQCGTYYYEPQRPTAALALAVGLVTALARRAV